MQKYELNSRIENCKIGDIINIRFGQFEIKEIKEKTVTIEIMSVIPPWQDYANEYLNEK
jgi:hypothetical protein